MAEINDNTSKMQPRVQDAPKPEAIGASYDLALSICEGMNLLEIQCQRGLLLEQCPSAGTFAIYLLEFLLV